MNKKMLSDNISVQGHDNQYILMTVPTTIIKKPNKLIQKQAEVIKRHFPREDTQMIKGHIKKCSLLLMIKKIQIKIQ